MQKAVQESTWDDGAIRTFMADPTTWSTAWIVGPHRVLFFGASPQQEQQDVAEECGRLWDWLGVTRPFTLILWWRKDPRHIAANEWPSKTTVNGGWTHQNASTIHVYRQEEWDRVFLHEMIHALGWDWAMPERPLACWGLPTGSNTVPALFEAWTELYAEWLWCVWHNVPWRTQRTWQDTQARQILARQRGPWKENTSVFAYYVLKAALAPHIDQLLLFGNGLHAQRTEVLCRLATPGLSRLREEATQEVPEAISLRMTVQ